MIHEKVISALQEAAKSKEPYDGYPTERLIIDKIPQCEGPIEIPEGPWEYNSTDLPSPGETTAFIEAGYAVDSLGRPLHPAFDTMVTNPEVGVVTGKGAYWNWGPNFTADPIVITHSKRPRVLLIKRGDTGAWALPGGFIDAGECDAELSARRELKEEANFTAPDSSNIIYVGVVGDVRTTAHAWPETSAYLYQVDKHSPVKAGDDAKDARWFRFDEIDQRVFGSHNFLIHEAVNVAEYSEVRSLADILAQPKEQLDITLVQNGHMEYDHMIVSDESSALFVKQHLPERFTDAKREARSLVYLYKENAVCEYFAQRGFIYLPERIDLINNSMLVMDALLAKDGWYWGVPDNEAKRIRYITDVLQVLDELQLVEPEYPEKPEEEPEYRHGISATQETIWREGWDSMTDEQISRIRVKAHELSSVWDPEWQESVASLLEHLASLRQQSTSIPRPSEKDLYMSHHDMRPSNIAWHPEHGVRIVDWSWADPGLKDCDATTFLIDLKKSGHDVTPYMSYFNPDHALAMIGFWLSHTLWETRDESSTVRAQQLASACAAVELLGLSQ